MSLKRVFIVAILFVFAGFVLQNTEMVQVRFLFWKAEAPRALVLMATFAAGLVTGGLLAWQRRGRDRTDPLKPH